MRKALNENPVVQVVLLGILGIVVAFLFMTRRHGPRRGAPARRTPPTTDGRPAQRQLRRRPDPTAAPRRRRRPPAHGAGDAAGRRRARLRGRAGPPGRRRRRLRARRRRSSSWSCSARVSRTAARAPRSRTGSASRNDTTVFVTERAKTSPLLADRRGRRPRPRAGARRPRSRSAQAEGALPEAPPSATGSAGRRASSRRVRTPSTRASSSRTTRADPRRRPRYLRAG